MTEWLGIGHLFELSRTEAIAGFLTPLAICAVFFLAQLVLPGRVYPAGAALRRSRAAYDPP